MKLENSPRRASTVENVYIASFVKWELMKILAKTSVIEWIGELYHVNVQF